MLSAESQALCGGAAVLSFFQKRPVFLQKSPIFYQKSRIFYQKSPAFYIPIRRVRMFFTQETCILPSNRSSSIFYKNSPTLSSKKLYHLANELCISNKRALYAVNDVCKI